MAVWVGCSGDPPPNLSTTEQLAVVVGPPGFNFGTVTTGETSAPATFVVSPAGSGESDNTILQIVGCPGFTIQAPNLPGAEVFRHCGSVTPIDPNQTANAAEQCSEPSIRTYSFTATFSPPVEGPLNCIGQIIMNNGTQTFGMAGTGALPSFVIEVNPRAINFNDIRVGDQSDIRTVNVVNAGSLELAVTATLTGDAEILLLQGAKNSFVIPKGAAENYDFACSPSGTANYSATLTLQSTDPVNPTTEVALLCHGIQSDLDISPTAFLVATLVDQPKSATITLTNEGNVAGTINSVVMAPGANPAITFTDKPANNTPLAAGATRAVTVEFSPDAQVTESDLAAVIVSFDSDADRLVTITGGAKLATVAADPTEVDFGPSCVGFPTPKTVDVYAAADGAFNVMGANTVAPFSVAETTLTVPKKLTPPGSDRQRFNVSVNPTEPGPLTGTLEVITDAPNQTGFEIPIRATALPAGVTALPEELVVGAVEVTKFTSAQIVTFTNCSMAPVMITDERIVGPHADDFVLTRAFRQITVAPAETIEIDVQMAPRGVGRREAQLVIDFTGGTTTVDLIGDGLGAPRDRDTYYACSTGGGGAAWPIGVVVIGLVWRRRRRAKQTKSAAPSHLGGGAPPGLKMVRSAPR